MKIKPHIEYVLKYFNEYNIGDYIQFRDGRKFYEIKDIDDFWYRTIQLKGSTNWYKINSFNTLSNDN